MNEKCYSLNNLQKFGNKTFIYERKSLENEVIYSYKTIVQEVTKCSEHFRNYQLEENVGIAVDIKEHSATSIILLLSILNHNCHFYCLDLGETKDIDNFLRLSGIKYIITSNKFWNDNETRTGILPIFENVFYLDMYNSENCFKNESLCYTIATSGSTGVPKMVHVPYECIESNIKALSYILNVQENDIIYLGSPPTFDPFVVELFMTLKNGASILISSNEIRLNSQQLLEIMLPETTALRPGVTIYQTTPSLLRLFGKENIHDRILSNKSTLRCLILGGEEFPCKKELLSWLPSEFPQFGKHIFNIYGITEISCWSSIYEFMNFNTKSECVPLGKALDDSLYFRLIDESGNEISLNNCKGELEIGSSKRKCFTPQCDKSIKILESNEIIYRKTGDLVERDSEGNLYYIGRTNNTIKRLGKRLSLDSLEKKVENLLATKNVFYKPIFLWLKDTTKLILCLFNIEKPNDKDKLLNLKLLKENLEHYEQPDEILYNNELLLNSHGKVDRKRILENILVTKENTLQNPVEKFQDFLKNVLGFPTLNNENKTNDNQDSVAIKRLKLDTSISFFEAGGTSFQALSLASELAEIMFDTEKQRRILEMLLDDAVSIDQVIKFLSTSARNTESTSSNAEYLVYSTLSHRLKLLWRQDLKKCIDAAPSTYDEQYVLVGSHSYWLLTVNAATGEEISRLKLEDRIECPVVIVSPQLALVGCYDGFIYGFDFLKGTISWKLNVKGMIKAKPLVLGNLVIVASYAEDYNIMAFDLKLLTPIWSLKLGSKGIFSTPLHVTEDLVLFCTLDGTYVLIESAKGSIKWQKKLDTPIFSTPAKIVMSKEIFLGIAEVKGEIAICRVENGEKISTFQAEGNIFSGLTLHQSEDEINHSLLIFGCHDKNIYCLKLQHSTKELSLQWKFSLNSAVYSTPIVISKSYVLACSTKGSIVLLDLKQLKPLAQYDLEAEIFSTPCCLKGKFIYLGSRDNYLYAFEIET